MSYEQVSDILQLQDPALNASEAHGVASGMLCANPQCDAATWVDELLDNPSLTEEGRTLLMTLFEQTRKLLSPEQDDFSFDLFLPDLDENDDASQQAEALRSWCQGFLLGIGYQKQGRDWPSESDEILRDMVEFTKLESDIQNDEDEQALMEIQEYIRAAVQLLRDQLNKDADQQSSSPA